MAKLLGMIAALCAIAGCSTTPTPLVKATPAGPERLLAFQPKTEETSAKLIVTRDRGFTRSGCNLTLSIDSVLAARLKTGQTATFYLKPGEHLLRASKDSERRGLCALDKQRGSTSETLLRPGETKSYWLTVDVGGAISVQRSE